MASFLSGPVLVGASSSSLVGCLPVALACDGGWPANLARPHAAGHRPEYHSVSRNSYEVKRDRGVANPVTEISRLGLSRNWDARCFKTGSPGLRLWRFSPRRRVSDAKYFCKLLLCNNLCVYRMIWHASSIPLGRKTNQYRRFQNHKPKTYCHDPHHHHLRTTAHLRRTRTAQRAGQGLVALPTSLARLLKPTHNLTDFFQNGRNLAMIELVIGLTAFLMITFGVNEIRGNE